MRLHEFLRAFRWRNDQRAGAALLCREAESWGWSAWRRLRVQGDLMVAFLFKEGVRNMRTDFLAGPVVARQGVMLLN